MTDRSAESFPGPVTDADIVDWWTELGLPGLFDVHTHFLPPNIERAVWAVFDSAGDKLGREWPIRYRVPAHERVDFLRSIGVRRFPTLPYAHKPGVATYLNDWAADFKQRVPESLWSATLYAEPEASHYVPAFIEAGVEIVKVHVQVGEFRLADPVLDPAWSALERSGTPIVIHAGHGPVGNEFTGPSAMAALLDRHPDLFVIAAHMGAPDYAEFLDFAERYERFHLDTTMVFVDFFEGLGRFPDSLLPRLSGLRDKILLGSDCPTIPYPYAHQLEALARLDLGEDWLRAVCWDNGARIFGV